MERQASADIHASPGGVAAVQLVRSQSADNTSRDRNRRERVRREREVKQSDGERMFLERSLPAQHPGISITFPLSSICSYGDMTHVRVLCVCSL